MASLSEPRPAMMLEEGKEEDVVLETSSVRKTFGGVVAVDDVSIQVKKGTITMIIGPNGSGKTTLINVISGFYLPDRGRVYYKNIDITGMPPHKIFELGLVRTFQIPRLFHNLTVLENMLVAYPGNPGENIGVSLAKKRWSKVEEEVVEKAFRLLKFFNLDHLWDSPASNLSGGQMKLLDVARTLMSGAETMLMDEPIAGVNPALAHEIFSYLVKLKNEMKITFLIIEHRLEIATRYVDWVYAMARGRIISQGKPKQVLEDPLVIESYLEG